MSQVAASGEVLEQLAAAWQRGEPLKMYCTKHVEVDAASLLPPVAKMKREAFTQAEPYALLGLLQGPQRSRHRGHDGIQRFVDRRPAVDERVVPIEQDRLGPDDIRWRDCRAVGGGHAATTVCAV